MEAMLGEVGDWVFGGRSANGITTCTGLVSHAPDRKDLPAEIGIAQGGANN